jgi:hypothetical protein
VHYRRACRRHALPVILNAVINCTFEIFRKTPKKQDRRKPFPRQNDLQNRFTEAQIMSAGSIIKINLAGAQGCLACAGQSCTPDKFFLLILNERQIRRWIFCNFIILNTGINCAFEIFRKTPKKQDRRKPFPRQNDLQNRFTKAVLQTL